MRSFSLIFKNDKAKFPINASLVHCIRQFLKNINEKAKLDNKEENFEKSETSKNFQKTNK